MHGTCAQVSCPGLATPGSNASEVRAATMSTLMIGLVSIVIRDATQPPLPLALAAQASQSLVVMTRTARSAPADEERWETGQMLLQAVLVPLKVAQREGEAEDEPGIASRVGVQLLQRKMTADLGEAVSNLITAGGCARLDESMDLTAAVLKAGLGGSVGGEAATVIDTANYHATGRCARGRCAPRCCCRCPCCCCCCR
jgi:hypothetical protein